MADSISHHRIVPIMSPARLTSQPGGKGSEKQTGGAKMLQEDDLHIECLKERRLYAVPTPGDGNCLFYSLSDQLYGHQGRQGEIRERLVEHIRTNAAYFVQFVPDVGGERRAPRRAAAARSKSQSYSDRAATSEGQWAKFEKLLTQMKETGFWGGSVEIQAFCQAYQRDVYVYTDQGITPFTSHGSLEGRENQPVHIAYHNFQHYSSVRSVDGPHDGVPELSRPLGCQGSSSSSEERQDEASSRSASASTDDSTVETKEGETCQNPTAIAEAFPDIDDDTLRCALRRFAADLEGESSVDLDEEKFRAILPAIEADFIRTMQSLRDGPTSASTTHDCCSSSKPPSLIAGGSGSSTLTTPASTPASVCAPVSEPTDAATRSAATSTSTTAASVSPTKPPRRRLIRGIRPTARTLLRASSSRSSSRNSTASKRSAGRSDDEEEDGHDDELPLIRRRRGRDRKRRILQDMTLGISNAGTSTDDEDCRIISVRPRDVAEDDGGSGGKADEPASSETAEAEAEEAPSSNERASTAGESDSEFEGD
ncbi:extracellular OTU-like cysteine protease, putative [Trichophyton benhamiae CBS 112371]|uniref:Extracellular OTU-like cysteine protease, putative n=1 Tax=Arthroderma benhamiae (strain ATCC MYA-4681 / CBS 112371) TaxID=663331 RepID=D4B3K2_ARTBC|nr:extracellular OTU-like cysteine protease, putative [Trichophyton benhamiae CBS 112371]EFE29700.1 extracellular OTU-like cysteine protease, putative [Trichophyton benhamiae CBS 112371]